MSERTKTPPEEDPGRTGPLGQYPAILGVVLAIGLAVVLLLVSGALIDAENPSHAADHLAVAIPALLLAFALCRLCRPPKPTRIGRSSRYALVAGLVLNAGSLVAEAIGAFGYAGDQSRIKVLTTIHNGSWMIGFPGSVILLIGVVLAVLSVPQRRTPIAS